MARIISSDSIPVGGFTPGRILADPYSIMGLLGSGIASGSLWKADLSSISKKPESISA